VSCLHYEVDGHVAIVTLNRPDKQNSLNPEMAVRLSEAWHEIAGDPQIRVGIVTGNGSSFCAGGDLGTLIPIVNRAREPRDEWETRLSNERGILTNALLRDFDCRKPIIAAVNGHAVAGGMEILLGTDIRVVSDQAKLGLQEARFGVFPGGGGTVRLPAQSSFCMSMEMLLCAELMPADEAWRLGLVNRVVDAGDVFNVAMEMARKIAANAPLSVQAIRDAVRGSRGLKESEALALETELSKPVWRSADAKEGPKAFMEKRKPEFTGS
jgi:enoyl-CoA hydratase